MENLLKLDATRLYYAEFGQLIVRFFEDFDNSQLNADTDVDFKGLYDSLKQQIPTYNRALDMVRASEESQKIVQLDDDRDNDVKALRSSLKAFANAKTQAEKDAYNAVKLLLAEYKNVEFSSYEAETNKLNLLTEKLLSDEYSTHLATLGIVKFVNHLVDSNKAFNDLFAHRSFKTSQKEVFDTKLLRKQLYKDYKIMVNYVAALALVKKDPFYKDVLAIINNGRTYFNDVVVARRKSPDNQLPQA